MATAPTLTIAIPTYQRGAMLRHCLVSIIGQIGDADGRVTVRICDNTADDATERLIADLLRDHPWIRYSRNETNIGATPNMLRVVAQSEGDFVWCMGDDDMLMPGGIRRILKEIDSHPSLNASLLHLCGFSTDMQTMLRPTNADLDSRMGHRDRYFEDGPSALRAFAFHTGALSVLVFRRSAWEETIRFKPTAQYNQGYVMSFVYGNLIRRHGHASFVRQVVLGTRSGNDSFLAPGRFIERLALTVLDGQALFKEVFPDDPDSEIAMHRHTCGHFVAATIRGYVGDGAPMVLRWDALRLCLRYYYRFPEFYGHVVPALLCPRWLLRFYRHLNWRRKRSSISKTFDSTIEAEHAVEPGLRPSKQG